MIEQGIAQTIIAQLGGRRFIAMTGARNLIGGENYLMLSLPTGFASEWDQQCQDYPRLD